jgi:hypothetical protein
MEQHRVVERDLRRLDATDVAAEETLRGYAGAVLQVTHLLVRPWWPLTLLACLGSRRARRATAAALLVDTLVDLPTRPRPQGIGGFAARRLDDAAYGAGVWLGAWQRRSVRCLRPRVLR